MGEWENKIAVSTLIPQLLDFLNHIVDSTNIRCLLLPTTVKKRKSFVAANLYSMREGKACVSFCIIAMRNLLYTTPVRVRCCTTLLFLGPPCVNSGAELSCGERHRQGVIPLEQMFSSTVL